MSTSPSTNFITNKMCPFAQKAWIALEASNTPHEFKEISLYGVNGKPKWFLKLNPQGTVPVLSIGDTVIPDSDLILDYIASGSGSVGNDDKLVLDDTNSKLVGSVTMWRRSISERVIPIGKKAVLGGSKQDLFKLLKELDKSVEGPYLCGEILTVADCAAFPFLWRIDQEFGPLTKEAHGCGNFRKWIDMCGDTKAFRKTVQNSWWWWW